MIPNTIIHNMPKKIPKNASADPATATKTQNLMSEADRGCGGGKPLNRRTKLGEKAASIRTRAITPNKTHRAGDSPDWL